MTQAKQNYQVKSPIEQLKRTRWWKPTVKRYAAHLVAVNHYDCPQLRESFYVFAAEVLNCPEAIRDDLLRIDNPEPYELPVRYRAYDTPATGEMNFGAARR